MHTGKIREMLTELISAEAAEECMEEIEKIKNKDRYPPTIPVMASITIIRRYIKKGDPTIGKISEILEKMSCDCPPDNKNEIATQISVMLYSISKLLFFDGIYYDTGDKKE